MASNRGRCPGVERMTQEFQIFTFLNAARILVRNPRGLEPIERDVVRTYITVDLKQLSLDYIEYMY